MKARCVVHAAVNRVELAEAEVREPGEGEVLVAAAYTCVSPGTELRCLRTGREGERFVPGYSLAGRVLKRGPGVDMAEGAPVSVGGTRHAGGLKLQWGGHISHALVKATDVQPLPAEVGLLDAAVARMGAIAFHGLRLSRPLAAENVAVIGLGLIGQLAARLFHLAGARVVAADRSARRVAVAQAAGIEAVVAGDAPAEAFAAAMPEGADLVVDATGAPAVLPQALALGRDLPWDATPRAGLRYLLQGSYENGFAVPYQEAFAKETTFIVPRSFQPCDLAATMALLARGRLVVSDLATVRRPGEAAETYAELRDPQTALLTVAFDWRDTSCLTEGTT